MNTTERSPWYKRLLKGKPGEAPLPWLLCVILLGILATQYGTTLYRAHAVAERWKTGLSSLRLDRATSLQYIGRDREGAEFYAVEVARELAAGEMERLLVAELSDNYNLIIRYINDGTSMRDLTLYSGDKVVVGVTTRPDGSAGLSMTAMDGMYKGDLLMDMNCDGMYESRMHGGRLLRLNDEGEAQ